MSRRPLSRLSICVPGRREVREGSRQDSGRTVLLTFTNWVEASRRIPVRLVPTTKSGLYLVLSSVVNSDVNALYQSGSDRVHFPTLNTTLFGGIYKLGLRHHWCRNRTKYIDKKKIILLVMDYYKTRRIITVHNPVFELFETLFSS